MRESIALFMQSGGTRLRTFFSDQRGSATVWNLVWMANVLVAGGVAVDSTNTWRLKSAMQSAADMAALTAVKGLPDPAAALDEMQAFRAQLTDASPYAQVAVRAEDVTFGAWDPVSRTFEADAAEPNAVRVTLKRSARTGSLVGGEVLSLVGLETIELEVSATAVRSVPPACAGCPPAVPAPLHISALVL